MFETRPTNEITDVMMDGNRVVFNLYLKTLQLFKLTNSGHAGLVEGKLLFGWDLHHDAVAKLPDECAVCAGRMN